MPSLSLKASINYPFIGGPSGPSYDPDAQAWFTAVEAAGGSITSQNKTAFNTAFVSIKTTAIYNDNPSQAGYLWDYIGVGYFLIGQESFGNGLFIPFGGPALSAPSGGWAQATPYSYTSSDYNKLTGLIGDGASKYFSIDQLNNNRTGDWTPTGGTRMAYTYKKIDYSQGGFSVAPYGTSVGSSRTFGMNFSVTGVGGLFGGGSILNNRAAVNTMPTPLTGLPQTYGAVGIYSSRGVLDGGAVAFRLGGLPESVSLGTPNTTSLPNTPMLFGRNGSAYDTQRTLFACFGKQFNNYPVSGEPDPFGKLNAIMETLITSLA
jgi:hypothetical protein